MTGHGHKIFGMFQNTMGPVKLLHDFNPLNAKLNPICHLLALLGAHHIIYVSRIRLKRQVKSHLPLAGIIRSSLYYLR